MIRLALALLLAAAAPAASAQQAAPSTPAAGTLADTPPTCPATCVTLATSEGPILLSLQADRAPKTVANFLRYVDARRFDGIAFYRALNLGQGIGLVQAGVRNGRLLYPPVALEPTSETGLAHVDGTISMARGARDSATADFFITTGPIPSLDANPANPGDNEGFAAFGRVFAGMDVVRRILAAPVSPDLGEGAMKGQMLAAPVRILTARRAK